MSPEFLVSAQTPKYGEKAIFSAILIPMNEPSFEWDEAKNLENSRKHGVNFCEAQAAFLDAKRVIAEDLEHSQKEKRFYCFGSNREDTGILTVRFTYRSGRIRIIGAGYWRKGKKVYEQANSV